MRAVARSSSLSGRCLLLESFSLLLDECSGLRYSLPDQVYDRRQEFPDGHGGKVTVAHLGNWELQRLYTADTGEKLAEAAQEPHPATGMENQKGKKKQKEGRKHTVDVGQKKLAKSFQDVQKASRQAMRIRCFGIIGKKYFGLFPKRTQARDIVCVFSGCHVPFALRKREDGEKSQLVGECYVHGIMEGEVVDMDSLRPER